jgi:phosphoglycolate phosphatase-like HAD superfamily hydrolase
MKITLYPIFEEDGTSKIGSHPKAVILWENNQTTIQTNDKELEEKLKEFYSKPLSVRRSVPPKDGIIGFKEIEIPPNTEEFFKESVYLIRNLNYYGKLEGERKVQTVALDFDGTLWDSVHECFVMTCEAYKKLNWALPDVPNLEEKFKRGRYFVRTGQEFYLLMHWISENPNRDPASMTLEEQEALRKIEGPSLIFEKVFYETRQEWREKRFPEWCALQQPYPGILKQLEKIQKNFSRVVIATTKDSDSVKQLLGQYNISLDVIGKETTVDKARQMNFIASTYKTPLNHIIFVDDLLDQVRLIKSIGVKGAVAGWGYGSNEQKEEAYRLGIPVLELENFAEQLTKMF